MELDDARGHRALGFFDLGVVDEPLFAQARLDGHIGAFRVTNGVLVGLDLDEGAELFEQLGRCLPGLEALHARQRTGVGVHGAVGVHHIEDRKVMTLADIEVGAVVGRGHLEHACAEGAFDGGVADDLDLGAGERAPDVLADEVLVALVFGVDGHSRVAGDGFGTSRGDLQERARMLDDLVAHLEERALGGLHDHFFVGQAGLRNRAPIDHALTAVDVAAFVERDEGLEDGLRIASVQRMHLAVPVAGCAELAELVQDDATVLVAPLGCDLDELLAAEVMAGLAVVLTQVFFDARLRGDTGVVGAGQPEGGFAFLASAAHHDVLQRVVEQVAHVQHTGDVGRRDHDRERRTGRIDLAGEAASGDPAVIPLLFDPLGVVGLGNFGHREW